MGHQLTACGRVRAEPSLVGCHMGCDADRLICTSRAMSFPKGQHGFAVTPRLLARDEGSCVRGCRDPPGDVLLTVRVAVRCAYFTEARRTGSCHSGSRPSGSRSDAAHSMSALVGSPLAARACLQC